MALSASSSSSPLAVRFATASVTSNGSPSVSGSATTCSTGRPVASRTRSIRSRRSQPERVAGYVEMMISSGRYAWTASIVAEYGVGVADLADRVDVLGASELEREVDPRLGGVEHRVVVDHEPRPRPVLGRDEHEPHVALGGSFADRLEQRAAAERLVGDDQDRSSRVALLARSAAVTVPAVDASAPRPAA